MIPPVSQSSQLFQLSSQVETALHAVQTDINELRDAGKGAEASLTRISDQLNSLSVSITPNPPCAVAPVPSSTAPAVQTPDSAFFQFSSTKPNPAEPEPVQLGRPRLSREKRRLVYGLCLYCGGAGHELKTCPVRPRSIPSN